MDGLLWILIGLGAGVVIATLSVDARPRSVSQSGWRRVGITVAGAIGALIGGFALSMLEPAMRGDGMTTAVAALAGALWLSWIVEITVSRRRHGDDTGAPEPDLMYDSIRAVDMPAYDVTREALVEGLTEDAVAHDAGRYAEVGRQFAAVRATLARQDAPQSSRLHVALRFWHGWMLARDERWPGDDSLDPMVAADWPRVARGIASDLALDRDISDPRVAARFSIRTPALVSAGHSPTTAATTPTP